METQMPRNQQLNPTPKADTLARRSKQSKTVAAPAKGRRFTAEQRQHALLLVASGVDKAEVARIIGTTDKSVREWTRKAKAEGTMPEVPTAQAAESQSSPVPPASTPDAPASDSPQIEATIAVPNNLATAATDGETPTTASSSKGSVATPTKRPLYAPKDPGQGLGDIEVAAILELKKHHPSYGPAQLRAQLKRFKGWRVSNRAIARVLKAHGYELMHRGSRPQGPEPIRFEAPRRNALWQMDYALMRVGGDKFHVLIALDDFSRYVVGYRLTDSPSSEAAIELLRHAIARHGKPEAVRTDRGGAFLSGEFKQALEDDLIDHSVGRAYHPQGGGKVESMIGTLRRELWDVEQFADRAEAERRLRVFLDDYNERRAHMGIDGLTPADRYFGRADQVLARLDAISRRRNGALDQRGLAGAAFEEVLGLHSGAPMEVLRLVVVDGQMELRLCGARVSLGVVEI